MINNDILYALDAITNKGFLKKKINQYIIRKKDILNTINIENQKVFLLDYTGDIVFDIIKLKPQQIDCYLDNIFSKYYIELKIVFVKYKTYKEFISFFVKTKENNKIFDYDAYYNISFFLNEQTRLFWDALYENTNYNGLVIRNSNLFEQKNYRIKDYIAIDDYKIIKDRIAKTKIFFLKSNEYDPKDYFYIFDKSA